MKACGKGSERRLIRVCERVGRERALCPHACWAPNLGSSVHHVSVPRLVANVHNSNKIDIKNHTFIANGENILHGSFYIAWDIALVVHIRVV
jgi:hypothetical protein